MDGKGRGVKAFLFENFGKLSRATLLLRKLAIDQSISRKFFKKLKPSGKSFRFPPVLSKLHSTSPGEHFEHDFLESLESFLSFS